VQSLLRAVTEGQISVERIDSSVLRILETKERLGLQRNRLVDAEAAGGAWLVPRTSRGGGDRALLDHGRSQRRRRPAASCRGAAARPPSGLVKRCPQPADPGDSEEELEARRIPAETVNLGPEVSEETLAGLVEKARGATQVVASCFVRVAGSKGRPT